MIEYLADTDLTVSDMESFIREVDDDFYPPLSTRTDLSQYAERLCREAVTIVILGDDGHEIVACISFYCTPYHYDFASLSFIAVSRSHRGKSYGAKLVNEMINYVKQAGMQGIDTLTWRGNESMIRMIENYGFEFVDEGSSVSGRTSFRYRHKFTET